MLIITSLLMILLVLLHKGKGSGLSDLFGGGISSNYGGSSVVERNLIASQSSLAACGSRWLWLYLLS